MRASFLVATLVAASACGTLLAIDPDEAQPVPDAAVDWAAPVEGGDFDALTDAAVSDAAPDAPRGKLVFVTSAVYRGALGGLDGGDDLCTLEARSSGLTGSFVAYLRPQVAAHAADCLSDGGWSRADGRVVFEGSPRSSTPKVPIEMTADAAVVDAGETVWTGMTFSPSSACAFSSEPWTNQSGAETAGTGDPKRIDKAWSESNAQRCDQQRHLYCFEQ